MNLESLVIKYNPSSFTDYDGTPAKGYSGVIKLSTKIGSVSVILNQEDIDAIVKVVAGKVAQDMVELSKTVTNDVANIVSGNLLEHSPTPAELPETELPF